MKNIFNTHVLNPYRAKGRRYNWLRGHTGVDLDFITGDELHSPVTGEVIGMLVQHEMGITLYVRDALGSIHVFAHLQKIHVQLHQQINRGDLLAHTNNTGTATSGPHLHYEIVTIQPVNIIDRIMKRKELSLALKGHGYNTNPVEYLKGLYQKYGVPIPE